MHTLASILLVGDSIGMCFVFLVIAGVIALIVWGARHQKKVREAWLTFARTHKLQVQGAQNRPTIQGWYGSTWIMLNTVVRGSGKNRSTFTQHHATINAPMPQGIVLYKEGFFSKVGKTFGGQDVQTGDRQLDDAFIIKGNDLMGIHDLLTIPAVKQALLYVIARHPGIRIDGKRVLVEHNGMTGDLNKLEGMFSDLSYLVQTFDAAYQELVNRKSGGKPAQTKSEPKYSAKSNRSAPVSSKAAAAEILGDAFFKNQPAPQTRRAAADEDPATRAAAFAQMADVLHQYEEKLESGEVVPEKKPFESVDAFASTPSTAFETPDSTSSFNDYDPKSAWDAGGNAFDEAVATGAATDAFKDPEAGDAFDDPTPVEETPKAEEDAPMEVGINFDELVATLSDSSLLSGDREKLIAANSNKSYELEMIVERVDSTWGFDTPDELKDGKTVEGKLKGGDAKVTMRFPKSQNDKIGKLRSGETLKAWGSLTSWDDLFKKATLDAG